MCTCVVYSDYMVFNCILTPTHFFVQVKSQRTQPIHHGTVVRFLLYGNHNQDVFATGGQVEVSLVRKELWSLCLTKFVFFFKS